MSVPPSGQRPSSTPPSKEGKRLEDEDQKSKKPFKMPTRREQPGKDKEEPIKKKGLFDLTAKEISIEQKQQQLQQEIKTATAGAEKATAIEEKAQIRQVSQIIQTMVESMRIGQMYGKDFASLDLKKGPEVPPAFEGSNLTVSYEMNGITIHFDRFMTPQQQNQAITLVERNKEQLLDMIQALNAKQIQVQEFTIGTHTIALPRVEPLPPPFQAPPSAEGEGARERRGGREGGEQGQRGGGGGPTR